MTTILNFIRQVAVYMLLLSFILSLLPDGSYKPIIRTIGGIMLLLSCLGQLPLLDTVAAQTGNLFDGIFAEQNLNDWKQELEQGNSVYRQSMLEETENILRQRLEEQIGDSQYEIGELNLSWDSGENAFVLELALTDTSGGRELFSEYSKENKKQTVVIDKLKTYISDFYPIEAANIHITIQR